MADDRAPGWYPDPEYPDDERFWNGRAWVGSRPLGAHDAVPPRDRGAKNWISVLVGTVIVVSVLYVYLRVGP